MKEPKVTVFTPVYNMANRVIPSLEAVKAQTFQDFEHIIVDDASTDDSYRVVEEWIHKNNYPARLLRNEKNLGLPKTLNRIISEARGKYLVGVSDDLLAPEFLQSMFDEFERLPEDYAVVHCDCRVVDDQGREILASFSANLGLGGDSAPAYFHRLLEGNCISAIAVMTRRSALKEIGSYDESLKYEDWDMWLRLSRKFKIRYFARNMVTYIRHKGAMSERMHTFPFEETTVRLLCKHLAEDDVAADRLIRGEMMKIVSRHVLAPADARALLKHYLAKKSDAVLESMDRILSIPGGGIPLYALLKIRRALKKTRAGLRLV